jgi:hypothetical protein
VATTTMVVAMTSALAVGVGVDVGVVGVVMVH